MSRLARGALIAWALSLSPFAAAHEFWLWPSPFSIPAGGATSLSMQVGEYFEGEHIALTPWHAAGIRIHAQGERPAGVAMRSEPPSLHMTFPHSGTHVVTFDSAPSMLTLSADKFHAYLHEEGLDAIIRQRERDGTAETPGRERYRRHTKALVRVGRADGGFASRTGQRLEILPLANPLSASPGDTIGFRLLFDDKPLPDALVKAWHRKGGQTVTVRARSDAEGRIRMTLPYTGPWMISTVHMVPATGTPEADWDSFWGNLTFELPARR